jgi:hypothetical protein
VKDPDGKRPLLRPGDRWDNVKTDLKDIGTRGVGWIILPQDRNKYETFVTWQRNLDFIKCRKFLDKPRNYQLFKTVN